METRQTSPWIQAITQRLQNFNRRRGGAVCRAVGLDLGSHSITIAEVEQTPTGYRLINSLIQELPVTESVQGAQAIDRAGWLESVVKAFGAHEAHVGISGPQVVVRRVHLPLMPSSELGEAVKWQIKEHLPFPVAEAIVDARVVGEVWEKDIKKQDVLVAAVSRTVLEETLSMLAHAGVEVAGVVPAACAVWRSIEVLAPDARTGSVAVIEIGASSTAVTVAKEGQIRLVRELAVGGSAMTEAFVGVVTSETGEITIDRTKAESLKRRYGVVTEEATGVTAEGVPLFQLASLLRPVLEKLLTELSRVLDFYKIQLGEAGVSRVLLCGAEANLVHLQSFLAEGLGVTVEVFNPLMRLTEHVKAFQPEQIVEDGPRLAAAIGLALEQGESLNLLPIEVRGAKRSVVAWRVLRVAAKVAAACAVGVALACGAAMGVLQYRIRQQEQLWAVLEPSYRDAFKLMTERQAIEVAGAHIQRLVDQQPLWEALCKEVSTLIPATIELDEITFRGGSEHLAGSMQVQLKGHVAVADASGASSVSGFVEALKRSPFFIHVELTSAELSSSEANKNSFTIEGLLE